MAAILLTTVNAKWIHPSLALRLLKANLGPLENQCEIIEFALRQPLGEKIEPLLAAQPRILGISVSIWNHINTVELLGELEKKWASNDQAGENGGQCFPRPLVILGGPEVSHLPPEADIFRFADYVICGEGEAAFMTLCEHILADAEQPPKPYQKGKAVFIYAEQVNVNTIKSAYHLYTDEDVRKKLIYVEASRGCPFNCGFCLSAVKPANSAGAIREFPLEPFLAEMDALIRRGVRTFKFLDRTFNLDIERAKRIMAFFLDRMENRDAKPCTVHFEMVPSRFPPDLLETIARFPPGTLRLEIGIQTLNPAVSERINRPSDPERELKTLSFLREKTSAIIHVDLIAGLPGEDIDSFSKGFDRLWAVLYTHMPSQAAAHPRAEIQLGILKLLPGTPLARAGLSSRYSPSPPYEVLETDALSASDLERIKNFARFWELLVNRGLLDADVLERNKDGEASIFGPFMALSDALLDRFGRNWGIDRGELLSAVKEVKFGSCNRQVPEQWQSNSPRFHR